MTYFLDLFAGIGGFRLGAEWAGLQFGGHYYSEVDPYAIKVYSLRFPDSIPLGDIRSIHGADLPVGDWIISGGFPCQDISVAGKGAGLAGERSGLWYEYARIIGELRPRYAIMENVGALAFRGLDSVLGSLAALGYDAEWQDIRASDVGAPHRRERLWILAYPEGSGSGRTGSGTETRFARSRSSSALSSSLADADKQSMGRPTEPRRQCGQWATEPDVGGTLDGFPAWLDGFDGIDTHKYNMTYGATEKERPGEILRALRNEIGASQDQWQTRGSECISSQEVLLAYLCKLETRLDKQTDLFVESTEASQGLLRSMRDEEESSSAPCRPESKKQHAREYRDSLQALPRLLACDAEKAWLAYRRENAPSLLNHWLSGWEDGIPRVSSNVPARVDRLKCLGNSIVPQIAGMIFSSSVFDEWRGI